MSMAIVIYAMIVSFLLIYIRHKSRNETLYNVIGRIVYQDFAGSFPIDSVFVMEIDNVMPSLSVTEKVHFLTWAISRYKYSSSIMTAIYEIAEKYSMAKLLDYHLAMLQDNSSDTEKKLELQRIRKALNGCAD